MKEPYLGFDQEEAERFYFGDARWEHEKCASCWKKYAIPSEWANEECAKVDGSFCQVIFDWVTGETEACEYWEE